MDKYMGKYGFYSRAYWSLRWVSELEDKQNLDLEERYLKVEEYINYVKHA